MKKIKELNLKLDSGSEVDITIDKMTSVDGSATRKWRSLTQRILLLDVKASSSNDQVVCRILGASGQTYDITVHVDTHPVDNEHPIRASCNCMDATMRNVWCKHLYWLSSKRFNSLPVDQWEISNYLQLLHDARFLSTFVKGRNDQCPICLEDIDYDNENTVCCATICQNSVHRMCWSRFVCETYDYRCVCCRTPLV
jgi:predicted transposase YbfD/YdcC